MITCVLSVVCCALLQSSLLFQFYKFGHINSTETIQHSSSLRKVLCLTTILSSLPVFQMRPFAGFPCLFFIILNDNLCFCFTLPIWTHFYGFHLIMFVLGCFILLLYHLYAFCMCRFKFLSTGSCLVTCNIQQHFSGQILDHTSLYELQTLCAPALLCIA